MNKKFLTLLAGAFLGFTAVSSVNAQSSTLESQRLRVGDPVKKLELGPNKGYYMLTVDSVVRYNKTMSYSPGVATSTIDITNWNSGTGSNPLVIGYVDTFSNPYNYGRLIGYQQLTGNKQYAVDSAAKYGGYADAFVLYMGKDSAGQNSLFVAGLNNAMQTGVGLGGWMTNSIAVKEFETANKHSAVNHGAVRGERSAAALWCVTVNEFTQNTPTFDFTNKGRDVLLEVNAYDHEAWSSAGSKDGWQVSDYLSTSNTNAQIPGGVSNWEFSETYKTTVNGGRPLVAYIDENRDTVAVLCMDPNNSEPPRGYVQVKIVPAQAVKEKKVDGMLLFTLKEAMPWALGADDYATLLGSESTSKARKLVFEPEGEGPIAANELDVELLTGTVLTSTTMKVDTNSNRRKWDSNYYAWNVKDSTGKWTILSGTSLDMLGYVLLKTKDGKYLYADTAYYNSGNTMFPKISTGDITSVNSANYMLGQYAWRMVYDPSADNILINVFSAAYKPTYDPKAITDSTKFATDSVVRSWYTYTAYPDGHAMDTTGFQGTANSEIVMTKPLKTGTNPKRIGTTGAPTDYIWYNRLYLSVQNLTEGNKLTLSHEQNTQVNFDLYTPCKASGAANRPTLASDLYLIRNEEGQYLHVPLYSAHDSAVWVSLDKDVHPELLPSFQWIVQSRYATSATSSIVNIINREFGFKLDSANNFSGAKAGDYGLAFTNIKLQNQSAPFKLTAKNYNWNNKNVNAKSVKFSEVKDMNEKNGATFIKLEGKSKNDPFLGYTWIDPDTSLVNLYGFNYVNGINDKYYIKPGSTEYSFSMGDYPNTDTLLYVNGSDYFDIAYFRIDTVAEDYGTLKNYGYDPADKSNQVKGLAQLKRQAYRIIYENPFKYCTGTLCLSNAEQGRYSLSSKLRYSDVLGKPVFWLRHVYHEGADLTPDFALVQQVDTASIKNKGGYSATSQLHAYVTNMLGKTVADNMVQQLKYAGEVNPGLFVVAVDDQTLKLKSDYRGDVVTRVSTFRQIKDIDPIYRRFNTEKEGTQAGDTPEIVKFYTTNASEYQLFENTGSLSDQKNYYTGGKNYLGLVNTLQSPNAKTAIYVDTAFVNRGKGYVRPQYLLMVRPTVTEDTLACDAYGETITIDGYKRGMYLINATDSADASSAEPNGDYIWNTSWERLVFTDAIHANDKLYILGGADLTPVMSSGRIDLAKLDKVAKPASKANKGKNIIQYYDLGETIKDANGVSTGWPTYKDCAFQFRLIERRADDFLIESETTDRGQEPVAKPCYGGWIKIQNGVPVISRSDVVSAESQAEIFNVKATTEQPVANEDAPATTEVKVVANNGSVTIMNAAGKKVAISNVLGQAVANTVLASDNATIAAPQGVVIVAVEGEAAVKALVK